MAQHNGEWTIETASCDQKGKIFCFRSLIFPFSKSIFNRTTASIYGVSDRITFIVGDFVEFAKAHASHWNSVKKKLNVSHKGKEKAVENEDEDHSDEQKWNGMHKAKIDA